MVDLERRKSFSYVIFYLKPFINYHKIMEETKKEDCLCTELTVVKKGFNGFYAVLGICVACFVSWLVLGTIAETKPENVTMFYYGCTILLFASPLTGTLGMNNLRSVCPKCGKTKELI